MSGAGQVVGRISIKVTPDTDGFRRKLKAELEEIENSLRANIPVDIDINSAQAKADFRRVVDQMKAEGAKGVKIQADVDVDKSALDRLRLAGTGGRNFGGGGGFPLGAFADNLAVVAAAALFAAPALALVSGALTTIPALAAGVLTPIGAIALGLDGIKESAKQLEGPLEDLKASVSSTFEDRLTPVFSKLIPLMDQLKAPMDVVANGLSDVADSFITAISTGPGLDALKSTISNIGDTFATLAPGVGTFSTTLLGLADKVSAKFPAVSEYINDVADSFGRWFTEISTPGANGVSPLDTAMSNFGGTLKEVLGLGGDLASQGFDFLADPKFGEDMKNFVGDLRTLTNDVLPGLKTGFQDLAEPFHDIVTVLDKINDFKLPDWLTGDKQPDPIKVEGDDKPRSKGWFEGVDVEANKAGEQAARGFWYPFTSPDAPWRDMKVFQGLDAMGKDFQDQSIAKKLFGPVGDFFWQNMFGTANAAPPDDAVNNAQQQGANLGKKAQESFRQSFIGQGGFDTPAPQANQAQNQAAQAAPQVAQMQQTVAQLQAQIAAIGPQIQAALTPITQIPAQVAAAFSQVASAVAAAVTPMVTTVATAAQQVVTAMSSSFAQIPQIATANFSQLASIAQSQMAAVVAAIQTGASQAVAAVQAMGSQITAALQQAAAGAQAAGAQVGAGMAAGIRGSIGQAVAAATELAAAVENASRTKLGIRSPSKVFHDIGMYTMEGFANGMDEAGQSVVQKAKDLSQQITDAMNNGLVGQLDPKSTMTEVNQTLKELEIYRKNLAIQQRGTDDKSAKDSLKSQIDQIAGLKEQIGLQKDVLDYSKSYGSSVTDSTSSLDQANNMLSDGLAKTIDAAKSFFMANFNQFQQDLGIGGGAITNGVGAGVDYLTGMLSNLAGSAFGGGTNINVLSVDDAISAKQTLQNKQSLQYMGR